MSRSLTGGSPFVVAARARPALAHAWRTDRLLTATGFVMLLVLGATLAGLVLDPRVITGAPAWLKPAKFAISISIYCFTLVWLLGFVRGHARLVRLVAWVTAGGLSAEMALIALQVVRGTTSHFNERSGFDFAVWSAMAVLIVTVWAMNLLAAVLLMRQRLPDQGFAWSLRLGVLVCFVGMAVAFLMTGGRDAHSVGVPDGGAGLPILGWSTQGGDLRAPHFVGLHALQALPLLGWSLARWGRGRLGEGSRVALVWIAGLGYLGAVLLLLWQALRAQPVIRPDAATLLAWGGLVGVIGVAGAAVLARARAGRAGR